MTRLIDTPIFIKRAEEIHGSRYNYSKVKYSNAKVKVSIICPEHGDFEQTPNNHTSGNGCPECAGVTTMSNSKFKKEALIKHNGRYDYTKVKITSYIDKIIIICPEHGDFEQSYENHLKGHGCRVCGSSRMRSAQSKTKSDFIRESRLVHGHRYDYSEVIYVNRNKPVNIICPEHGMFSQAPHTHFGGSGCQSCAVVGFNCQADGYLYLLRSNCGLYFKVGISNKYKNRIKSLKSSTPFDFVCLEIMKSDGRTVRGLEKAFHSSFTSAKMKGFNGATEWFKWDADVLSWFRLLMHP